ncbi:MAG: SDR family oxidoreductase [Caulobacteraceae bacterium]|nr:SDR family oxidoreductase [Caulobacteraceae bacterium]
MRRVEGKVAIVTGGTRGMGPHHARALVAEGARVVITSRGSLDQARALEAELGDACCYMPHDVASEADWLRVIADTEAKFGPASILVNNAGIAFLASTLQTTLDDYQRVCDINQRGTFLGIKHIVPSMRKAGGGSIINVSSASGLQAAKSSLVYGATKWAVRGMTRTAAVELARYNIRVNAIFPGLILSDMFTGGAEAEEALLKQVPLRRFAQGHECSPMVVFLASDESAYCTAADFVVDGGMTAI